MPGLRRHERRGRPRSRCESRSQVEPGDRAEFAETTGVTKVVGLAVVGVAPLGFGRIDLHAAHEISDPSAVSRAGAQFIVMLLHLFPSSCLDALCVSLQ